MDKLAQVAHFLVDIITHLYIVIIMLRFLLQLVRADFYNPLSQLIVNATNPLLLPLRKVIPGLMGIDLASILLAIILQMLALQLLGWIAGGGVYPLLPLLLVSIKQLILLLINIYFFAFLIIVILSWVAPNTYNPAVSLISSLTEPVLRPIRKVIPPMGGIDFSVMFAMLGISVLKILLA